MNRTPVPQRFRQQDEASPAQLNFINDLLEQRELDEPGRALVARDLERGLSKRQASDIIDNLKACAYKSRTTRT